MPRGIYERHPKPRRPVTLRRLQPGQPVPDGSPRRYRTTNGYVLLRWKVAPCTYVEIMEHRLVAGVPGLPHVHHRNHRRDDNSPENLQPIDALEHSRYHADLLRRFDVAEATRLYALGYGTPEIGRLLHVDASNVYRRLRSAGVQMRPPSVRTAIARENHTAAMQREMGRPERREVQRVNSKAMWAARSDAERAEVGRRISAAKRRVPA